VFAREFTEVRTDAELQQIIKANVKNSQRIYFLGGGSNILFKGDVDGLVIKISTNGIEIIKEDDEEVQIRVAAGEDWDKLVAYCVEKGWGGIENLSGIPGQVGSSPIQNIGAYGAELKDVFVSLEAINRCTGKTIHYDAASCQFGYRDSIFKGTLNERVVITQLILRLHKKPVFNLSYQALKQKLEHIQEKEITLQAIRETVLQIRASKLPDPKVIGSAGSFFKNPMVNSALLEQLKEKFPGIVYYTSSQFAVGSSQSLDTDESDTIDPGSTSGNRELGTANYKLAAGWLIEQCGWKGFREGDAGVNKDQALVLVNYGKATGMDILDLAAKIQRSVKEKFGVNLDREVNVV